MEQASKLGKGILGGKYHAAGRWAQTGNEDATCIYHW